MACAALALSGWGAFTESITYDEGSHLASGYAGLRLGDFRVNPEHPPLVKLWAALPLLARPTAWPGADDPAWKEGRTEELAIRWLEELNDGQALVVPARLFMLVFPALLLLGVTMAGWRLFGPAVAFGACLAAALDPSLLAHGHLVTTDVPVAAALLASLLALDRLLERPTGGRLAVFVLAVAAAATSKFSWLFLLPALVVEIVLLAASARRGAADPARITAGKIAGGLLVLAVGVWVAIWAAYGFRYFPYSEPRDTFVLRRVNVAGGPDARSTDEAWKLVTKDLVSGEERTGLLPKAVAIARSIRLLPEPYLFGLAYVDQRAEWRSSYLRGEISDRGNPSYFPIAFAVKTPLPTLAAAGLGLVWLFRRRLPPSRWPLARSLFVFSAVYVGTAIAGHLDIGYRHLFPVLPVVWILAGAGLAAAWEGKGRLAAILLVTWLVAGTVRGAPRFLPFFNEVAGGRANGWRWLADSNLDWGQDALRLKAWASRQPAGPVYLADYGDRPYPSGMTSVQLVGEGRGGSCTGPGPGTWVVSVNVWLGIYEPLVREATWADRAFVANARRAEEAAENPFTRPKIRAKATRDVALLRRGRVISRLRLRPPEEVVGDAYFVYRVSESEYRELSSF